MAALAADPRAGSHRSYRRTLDKEEPPPALFPPDASDPSQDDSPHASTTDPSQTCQSADGGQPWINGSKRRLPDWDSFYKNGLPNEIIVIDDTPEPGLVHPNAKTDAYHPITSTTKPNTSKKRKLDDALSTTHHYEHLGGDNGVDLGASAKKRKYEKAPEAHRPHLYEDGVSNGIEPSALLKRPYGVRSPILNSNSPASLSGSQVPAKRKRTRHQLANGVHAEQPDKPRLGPNIEYVGLGGPAQRAKDVLVRPGHSVGFSGASIGDGYADRLQTMLNGQKLHDDDGHYIVVPEASITNQCKKQEVFPKAYANWCKIKSPNSSAKEPSERSYKRSIFKRKISLPSRSYARYKNTGMQPSLSCGFFRHSDRTTPRTDTDAFTCETVSISTDIFASLWIS